MSDAKVLLAILITSFVTIAIRFLPFLIFRGGRKTPEIVEYLGKMLPAAVMAMLVVYCLKGISFKSAGGFLPELIAGGLVVGSYVWKRSTLLSIVLGTVCYMILVQFVF